MKRFQIRWPNEWLKRTRLFRTDLLSYSGKDFIVSVSLYLISVGFCLVLRNFDPNNDTSYVSMIFLLDVFLTALLTDGFFFSLTIAVFAVLSVDYIFTPPFWEVSFTLAGFPLTFLVMMTICVATGIVTSRAKKVSEMEREAEREKIHSNLLRAVSHDIRTPLTGIVGATNVLLEQDDVLTPQQRRELLKNANEEAQWLIHIVENLLSITRIGAGEDAQVTKTPEAAEEVIEGAVGKFRRQYPQIDVRVELPDPAGDDEPSGKRSRPRRHHHPGGGIPGKTGEMGPVHRVRQWPGHPGGTAAQPVRRHPERPEGGQHPQHGHRPVCVQNRGGSPPRQNKRRKYQGGRRPVHGGPAPGGG